MAANVDGGGEGGDGGRAAEIALPPLEAVWVDVWDEFVQLGGLKLASKKSIIKLLYLRSYAALKKEPTMHESEKRTKFEEIYKSNAARFVKTFGNEVSVEVNKAILADKAEGLYPIKKHRGKEANWVQQAADSRVNYKKWALPAWDDFRSAMDESGTNNCGELLKLLNYKILMAERDETMATAGNKAGAAAVAAAAAAAGAGAGAGDAEDDAVPAPAAGQDRKQQHKTFEALQNKFQKMIGETFSAEDKASADHLAFREIHILLPSLLFNSSDGGNDDVLGDYAKNSTGPTERPKGSGAQSMSRNQVQALADENRLRQAKDMAVIDWQTYKSLERSNQLLRKPARGSSGATDAASVSLASIASSTAKTIEINALTEKRQSLQLELETIKFQFQLCDPTDFDYDDRRTETREALKKVQGKLKEIADELAFLSSQRASAFAGSAASMSSASASGSGSGSGSGSLGRTPASAQQVREQLRGTVENANDRDGDASEEDDDNDDDDEEQRGTKRAPATRRVVTLNKRQKESLEKAVGTFNADKKRKVDQEDKICLDCHNSTDDPSPEGRKGYHVCLFSSCKRPLHSAVSCPYAAYCDDDTGKYYCRTCIEKNNSAHPLQVGLADAPTAPAKKSRL